MAFASTRPSVPYVRAWRAQHAAVCLRRSARRSARFSSRPVLANGARDPGESLRQTCRRAPTMVSLPRAVADSRVDWGSPQSVTPPFLWSSVSQPSRKLSIRRPSEPVDASHRLHAPRCRRAARGSRSKEPVTRALDDAAVRPLPLIHGQRYDPRRHSHPRLTV